MYRTDFWTLWEKARVGYSERIALKQVSYQGWNRLPAQAGCMRQVLGAGALGRPRGMVWGGRWEGGSGWGTHVTPWLIHVNVWQKPLQYCKVISLQLIKINEKQTNKQTGLHSLVCTVTCHLWMCTRQLQEDHSLQSFKPSLKQPKYPYSFSDASHASHHEQYHVNVPGKT